MHAGRATKTFPVIVTSYEIVIADAKHFQKFTWKYIVVDEGHRLKNYNCKLLRELRTLPAANKLLLTGARPWDVGARVQGAAGAQMLVRLPFHWVHFACCCACLYCIRFLCIRHSIAKPSRKGASWAEGWVP